MDHGPAAIRVELAAEGAGRAIAASSGAVFSPVKDDLQVELVPAVFREQSLEVSFCGLDVGTGAEPPALSESVNVRVYGECRHAEGLGHHHAGCFVPHARQGFQFLEAGRNEPVVGGDQNLCQLFNVACLGPGQPQLADVAQDCCFFQGGHGGRIGACCKKGGRHFVYFFVRALSAEQHRYQQGEWVAVIERYRCLWIGLIQALKDAFGAFAFVQGCLEAGMGGT